jgi:ketosteroid isomerase-like protein
VLSAAEAVNETAMFGSTRDPSVREYDAIRELFLRHCDRELAGDIDAVLETLTPDCVYELPQTGQRWEGHVGARRFYEELLTGFQITAGIFMTWSLALKAS